MLIKGCSFKSYGDALDGIEKPRTSSRIKRNIDTDKLYLNHYTFILHLNLNHIKMCSIKISDY